MPEILLRPPEAQGDSWPWPSRPAAVPFLQPLLSRGSYPPLLALGWVESHLILSSALSREPYISLTNLTSGQGRHQLPRQGSQISHPFYYATDLCGASRGGSAKA